MAPLITLEEHWLSETTLQNPKVKDLFDRFPSTLTSRLRDLSTLRLEHMDAGKVTLQVISHAPSRDTAPPACRAINDQLHAAVSRHPGRLAGFAMLPMAQPDAAAAELERCVKDLGFLGALLDNHLDDGTYFDGRAFWPVFAAAQALDVPLYLHPAFPGHNVDGLYGGNFADAVGFSMATSGWAWHTDVALHVLRLYAAGVFDEFPALQVVIGHDGEMLPFQFERVERISKGWTERRRDLRTVWDENIWITTSGMFSVNPIACMLRNTRVDRILYSVDYPFATNEMGLEFLDELAKSNLVTEEQMEMIMFRNAERLLKVKVQ